MCAPQVHAATPASFAGIPPVMDVVPPAHAAAAASFAGIPPVIDVVPPATRSMDYGKGWEGFTNDEMKEEGGCQTNECQPVKVLDYSWSKPVTVRGCQLPPPTGAASLPSGHSVSACYLRARGLRGHRVARTACVLTPHASPPLLRLRRSWTCAQD
jgi:hypothetical protein